MVFSISSTAIDPRALERGLESPGSGALAVFVGRVRDHNEDRQVERLEYEAYEAVCLAEGEQILEEAQARFGVLSLRCVHRAGMLEVGEPAVWVGVASAHRSEAFAACRFVIDEVKRRLPIWKKEHYADGTTEWTGCAHGPSHELELGAATVTIDELTARQQHLPEIGAEGQARLAESSVLVVGAGGLGCAALQYLAGAGVGRLGVCDGDRVEVSNLHRQPLYGIADLGAPKAELAAIRIRDINPFVEVAVHPTRVETETVEELLSGYAVVLDCTDGLDTKFLLNDACVVFSKTLVQAAIYQYEGQLWVFDPDSETPCLRCVWPEMPAPECAGTCAEGGVLGSVAGALGCLQATETLKQILGLPGKLSGETLFVDLLSYTTHRVRSQRDVACPVCGLCPAPPSLAVASPLEVEPAALKGDWLEDFQLIDIREDHEIGRSPLPDFPHVKLPITRFDLERAPIPNDRPCLLVCNHGSRSRQLAAALRERGWHNVHSLRGGLTALSSAGLLGRFSS